MVTAHQNDQESIHKQPVKSITRYQFTRMSVCLFAIGDGMSWGVREQRYLIRLKTRSATVEPKCDADFKSSGKHILRKHRSALRLRERVVCCSLELK